MSEDHIYSHFEVVKSNGEKVNLRIQDTRPVDVAKVLEFTFKYYVKEELFVKYAGIANREESLDEYRGLVKELLEDPMNHSLICVVDEGDHDNVTVVGSNHMFYCTNEDFELKMVTPEVKKMFQIIEEASKEYDVLKEHNIDACLLGAGLSVDPSFRGCGIATALLKARKPLLNKRGLSLTGAWFTSLGSQRAALAAGYRTVAEVPLSLLATRAHVALPDTPPSVMFMILKL